MSQAAAAWAVRLSDPLVTEAERAAFEAWRAASPAHEAAFERQAAAFGRFDRLRAMRPAGGEIDADLLAPAPPRGQAITRWAAAAAGAAVLAGAALWTITAPPAYATAVGERRLVVLEDGARVELNTDSRIVVRYRHGVREVKLVRGEALFDAPRDPARPFVVVARDRRVRTQGSAFNVRLQPGAVQVLVAEGAVQVAKDHAPAAAAPVRLAAGAVGLYGPEGGVARNLDTKRIDQALAWRHGQIALSGLTLEAAAAEFNRYSDEREIVVADPAIAAYRLGGYFRVDDMDGFVRALQTTFPVKATSADGAIYLSAAG